MSGLPLLPLILITAVVLAWARLLWSHRQTPGPIGRLALLLLLQPVCAGLLYLTLAPPRIPVQSGTLSVLTAGADPARATGAVVVSLPEAPEAPDATPVPDLATALRRHPGMALQVLGHGLAPRDRDALHGLVPRPSLAFEPAPLPAGLSHLHAPARVAPGAAFPVSGQVQGLAGGRVQLLDPAGQIVDVADLEDGGRFQLSGQARAPGLAEYAVQVLDAEGGDAGGSGIALQIAADAPLRTLLLAGAPSPEFRHLRRWATDAGFDLHVEVSTGAGVGLGDGPAPGTAEGFEDFDLAIIDTRALAVLGGTRRAALAEAIAGGLGVLLRVDGPLSAPVRARMAALGMAVEGEGALEPVALPRIEEADLLRARMGPGSEDAPFDPALAGEALPELERRAIAPAAEDAAPLQTGAAPVFAWWRAVGRGRVGLWTLTDSYPLALAGRDDLHAGLWSTMASALARPVADSGPWSDPQARTGTRMALCGLTVTEAVVRAPDGMQTPVRVDPAAGAQGCAAYWPSAPGWHLLTMQADQRGQEAQDTQWYFHVRAVGEAPGIEAAALQEATLRLAAGTDADGRTQVAGTTVRRGSSWPWFLAWLAASGLLWWLERRRAAAPASATVSRQPPPEQD